MDERQNDMMRFVEMPVYKAVLANALPAMAAMIMVLIYNLADTFFIGRTNDPFQVAAISLSTPIFMLCVSIGTVFGIGGTSLISRTLGAGNFKKAKNICSFCFYGSIASGLFLSLMIFLFSTGLLKLMGAEGASFAFARKYLLIVAIACPFAVVSNAFSNIVRSEGKSKEAMGGQILGNLINIILDPILISACNMGIGGAAIATVIGNVIGAAYYLLFYLAGKSSLSIRLKDFSMKDKIASGVLSVGIPAALGSFLMSTSQVIANSQMMDYGDLAVAGYGVAGKICMIEGIFCVGLGQGVQPLLGFCVGSKNRKRFKELIKAALVCALILGASLTVIVLLLRKQIVMSFLKDTQTVNYAITFTTILLSTGVLFGIFYVLSSILQAMGKGFASLIVNLSRQGLVFIPLLFILKAILGINGIVWAQPVADIVAVLCGSCICIAMVRKFMREEDGVPGRLPENESSR